MNKNQEIFMYLERIRMLSEKYFNKYSNSEKDYEIAFVLNEIACCSSKVIVDLKKLEEEYDN